MHTQFALCILRIILLAASACALQIYNCFKSLHACMYEHLMNDQHKTPGELQLANCNATAKNITVHLWFLIEAA